MSAEAWGFLGVFAVAVIGAGGVAFNSSLSTWVSRRNRAADADLVVASAVDKAVETLTRTYDATLERMESEIARLSSRQDENVHLIQSQAAAIVDLQAEISELRPLALRLQLLPTIHDALPMKSFVEDGWLDGLNDEVANPAGVHIALYTDDVDQLVALGWKIVPIELRPDVPDADLLRAMRRRARVAMVNEIRAVHGFDPVTPHVE